MVWALEDCENPVSWPREISRGDCEEILDSTRNFANTRAI